MDAKTEQIVKRCMLCQAATPQTVREPLAMSPLPDNPWKNVSVNFCQIANEYAMVIVE